MNSWKTYRFVALIGVLLLNAVFSFQVQAQRARRPPPRDLDEISPTLMSSAQAVPAGTIFALRMETRLDSKTAQPGDKFRARVSTPVGDAAGRVIIPVNSLVEGRVDAVERAKVRRRPGIIGVEFDRLVLTDGRSFKVNGVLTNVGEKPRRVDNDGNVKGPNLRRRDAAFIGGGAAGGALIGAIAGGALLGAGIGAGVGLTTALLAKGKEAVVEPGAGFGLELTQPVYVQPLRERPSAGGGGGGGNTRPRPSTPSFDQPLSRPTLPPTTLPPTTTPGNRPRPGLTPRVTTPPPAANPRPTTPSVGPRPTTPPRPREDPPSADAVPVNISSVQAERDANSRVLVRITAQTPTARWRIQTEQAVEGDLVEIKVLGVAPPGMSAQIISHPTTVVSVPDPTGAIRRVNVRGANGVRPVVLLTRPSPTAPNAPNDNSTQLGVRIADKLDEILLDYSGLLNARRMPDGTYSFGGGRRPTDAEAQLLFALRNLAESAGVFRGQLTPEVRRTAAKELNDGATEVNRIAQRVRVPADISRKWVPVQDEIKQLNAGLAQTRR